MRGIIPQKIKGFRDITPLQNQLHQHIIEKAGQVYKNYGFEQWDTPVLEYADCLGKYMPDADSAAEGVYSFRNPEQEPVLDEKGNRVADTDGNFLMENHFLSLRYDLTAPLSRHYAEKLWNSSFSGQISSFKPPLFRRYQYGTVYRFEAKLDPGRFREFRQIDFDTVGTSDIAADAEICMILSDALNAIGLDKSSYVIKVNNRKILSGLFHELNITGEKEAAVTRIIDKLDKIGIDGVKAELANGRKDPSGAFIQGINLDINSIDKLIGFLSINGISQPRGAMIDLLSNEFSNNEIYAAGLKELQEIDSLLNSLGYGSDGIVFDPSLVRGMAYYTGPIFEVQSLLSYTDAKGNKRGVGSICGGGRYDGLVKRLLGVDVPATGASIGVDRLAEILTLSEISKIEYSGPVLITVFDNSLMTEYQKIARELRANNIPVQVYYGVQKGLKKQLAYADSIKSPIAILLGEDELKAGVVTIRNLNLGTRMSGDIQNKDEWKAKAQQQVPLAGLISAVLDILKS